LARAVSVVCCIVFFVTSAGATPGGAESPGSSPEKNISTAAPPRGFQDPPSNLGFDASDLTGEKHLPFAARSRDALVPWNKPPALETPEEGTIVYQDPMAGLRSGSPPPPLVSPWRQWLLPGMAAVGIVIVIGAALTWRIAAARRAAQISSRFVLPPRKA
jgi:hypothetical protein